MRDRPVPLVGYLVLVATAIVLYAAGIDAPYFADDFQFVFDNPLANTANCLTLIYPPSEYATSFYRPIQTCFLLQVQGAAGLSTVPIHIVHIFLHAILSCLVCWTVFRFTSRRYPALVAGLAMAASQGNVLAVASNDTLSQLGGTLFGVAAIVALAARDRPNVCVHGLRRGLIHLLALLFLLLSLLSKEASVCFALLAIGVIVVAPARDVPRGRRMLRVMAEVAPILIVTFSYLAFRDSLHVRPASFGGGMYDFRFGLNVLRNIATLGISAVLAGSSVDLYAALKLRNLALVGVYSAVLGLWVAMLGWGLIRSRNLGHVAWLGLAAIVAMFPMALMNHVSELYTYSSMPFVAAMIGLALGSLLEAGGQAGFRRRAAVLVGAALLLSHGLAVQSKVRMMRDNGRRASELLPAVINAARNAAPGATITLVTTKPAGPTYSSFLVSDFDLLSDAGNWIRISAQRPDLKVTIVESGEASTSAPDVFRVTIENGRVVPMPHR